jgi:streptomycin 6-kinase
LASDAELSALLLERVWPGVPLAEQANDEENTRIAARVMRRYWRPEPSNHNLRTVTDRIAGLDRLRQRFDGTGPVPEIWVARAEAAFADLQATSKGSMVLHGDLHHWNILSAERQPWLAIDPHGFVGDSGYELDSFLGNLPAKACAGKDTSKLRARRAEILAEELDMSRERVLTWGWACSVLYAALYPDEWEGHIARAEELERLI